MTNDKLNKINRQLDNDIKLRKEEMKRKEKEMDTKDDELKLKIKELDKKDDEELRIKTITLP